MERRIHINLQALVLTALRRLQERQSAPAGPALPAVARGPGVGEPAWAPELGERLSRLRDLGSVFAAGEFRLGYLGAAFGPGILLLAGKEGSPVRIDLAPEAPRARIMESLLQ